jgi:hypothetical protein
MSNDAASPRDGRSRRTTWLALAAAALVVVLVALATVWAFQWCRTHDTPLRTLMPPEDLWEPLGDVTIPIDRADAEVELTFRARYGGNHGVDLVAPSREAVSPDTASGLRIQLRFSHGDEVLREVELDPNWRDSKFWGRSRCGYHLHRFSVPEDLPLGEPVVLRARVLRADDGALARHGAYRLAITKWSDK